MGDIGLQFDFGAEKEKLRIRGLNITRSYEDYRNLFIEFRGWKDEITDLLNEVRADEQADPFFYGDDLRLPDLPGSTYGKEDINKLKDEVKRLLKLIPDLSDKCPPDNIATEELTGDISFNEETGEITFRGRICKLPLRKMEYYFSKTLFSKPTGTRIKETEIIETFDTERYKEEKPSMVYDTRMRLNKRIEKDLGIKQLIGYAESNYWINSF